MSETELTEDILGDFGFRVRYSYSEYWCNVTVWQVVLVHEDGRHEFQRKDSDLIPDPVESTDDAARYLDGFIKWDGCSEFSFAPDDKDAAAGAGYHFHWCGPNGYKKHFALLEAIYRRAQTLMAKGNHDPWDKPHPEMRIRLVGST